MIRELIESDKGVGKIIKLLDDENNPYAICMASIQGKYGPKSTWSKEVENKYDRCVKESSG